jgi:hypothetical protein
MLKKLFHGHQPLYTIEGTSSKLFNLPYKASELVAEIKAVASKGLAINPQHPGCHFVLGKLAFWYKNHDDALLHLEKAKNLTTISN